MVNGRSGVKPIQDLYWPPEIWQIAVYVFNRRLRNQTQRVGFAIFIHVYSYACKPFHNLLAEIYSLLLSSTRVENCSYARRVAVHVA